MRLRTVVVVLLLAVVLAGCAGGPTDAPSEAPPVDPGLESGDVPGVSNGTLNNLTALTASTVAGFEETGGELRIQSPEGNGESVSRYTAEPAFSTYSLTQDYTDQGTQHATASYWANRTTMYGRMETDGQVRYRVFDRGDTHRSLLSSFEPFVDGGNYTVREVSPEDETVSLTAEEYAPPHDGQGPYAGVSSYNGSIVVTGDGRIQNVTVSMVDDGKSLTYRYELLEPSVGQVSQPAWIEEVPESAALHPDLDVTVEDDAYLALSHAGEDYVPANSTISIASNETDGEVRLAEDLRTDTRYLYFDGSTGDLRLTAERPGGDDVQPVTSPVSVTVSTADGVDLYSSSMGWGSESEERSRSEGGGQGSEG